MVLEKIQKKPKKFFKKLYPYWFSQLAYSKYLHELKRADSSIDTYKLLDILKNPVEVCYTVNIIRCLRENYKVEKDTDEVDLAIVLYAKYRKKLHKYMNNLGVPKYLYTPQTKGSEYGLPVFQEYVARGMVQPQRFCYDWQSEKPFEESTLMAQYVLMRKQYYIKLANWRVYYLKPFDSFKEASKYLSKVGLKEFLEIKYNK